MSSSYSQLYKFTNDCHFKVDTFQGFELPKTVNSSQEKVKLWHIIHDLVIGAEFNRGENRFWKIWFGRTFSSGEQIYKKNLDIF